MTGKPRLLYFGHSAEAFPVHMRYAYHRGVLKWLRHFFDTAVIAHDADYAECVDAHQPEVVLFESGGEKLNPLRITNTSASRDVPRAGFLLCDCHSPNRLVALSQFEAWGVDAVFSLDVAMGRHFPWPQERLFHVPWYVDTDVFTDLGNDRPIPVGLLGSGFFPPSIRYPWRGVVGPQVLERFPSFVAQRPFKDKQHEVVGDAYVQMLNRIRIGLADGGFEQRFVRKMLEIPASGCLLVAEPLEVLKRAGFKDGVNCVLAEGREVASRIESLLRDPREWEALRKNGCRLAHERHSFRNRNQLARWLQLHKAKSPDEKVVQRDLFGDLELESASRFSRPCSLDRNPLDECVETASRHLFEGRIPVAEVAFREALARIGWLAEGWLGLAVCFLWNGRFEKAVDSLDYVRKFIGRGAEGAESPWREDPVDSAFRMVALHALDWRDEVLELASSCWRVCHPALAGARGLLGLATAPEMETPPKAPTIHCIPDWTPSRWSAYMHDLIEHGCRARRRSLRRSRGRAFLQGAQSVIARLVVPGRSGETRKDVKEFTS